MRRCLTACLLLSLAPAVLVAQRSGAAEEEVTRIARQYLDARLANDTAVMRRILAEDFISINSNGAVSDRASAMRLPTNVTPNGAQIQGFDLDSVHVRVYDTTAIMTGARRVRISNEPPSAGVRFTFLFIRREDRWQIASSHTTDILTRRRTR